MVLSTLGWRRGMGWSSCSPLWRSVIFRLILNSMSDVFHGQADALKAKTKSTIVPLGRTMLEMIRELRLAQLRPVIQVSGDCPRGGRCRGGTAANRSAAARDGGSAGS